MPIRTVAFADEACAEISIAGGKGANLARMTAAGLSVPPGFVVTTGTYAEFIKAGGLQARIAQTIEATAPGTNADADALEAATAALRAEIVQAPMPRAMANAITTAYTAHGDDHRVAVRSSGTAEDLAEASFAGLHDTYLDIRGADAVLDAVRRCWASMWNARATSYRATRGFDQSALRIAVVVQQMVCAEVSGVMFTANPLSAATDELVINSTWGLGEALVSGIATPDEHVLALADLRVRSARRGSKERRVVRDPSAGSGTLTEDTPPELRERVALVPTQLRALGELGKRVMAYYDGIPQDIEWALAAGELYLLQSRPATGADFAWEEDLDYWQQHRDDGTVLWTRSWSDEVWNGAISPLAYSYRGEVFTRAISENMALWKLPPLTQPAFRYPGGTAYYNTAVEERLVTETAPAPFRVGLLAHVAPDRHQQVLNVRLSPLRYLEMHARILTLGKPVHGPLRYFKTIDEYIEKRQAEADGLSAEELRRLSDEQLIDYMERFVELKTKNTSDQWTEFFIMARDSFSMLAGVIALWYDPEPMLVITDLMSGSPVRTETAAENLELWRLSDRIRRSPDLRALFEEHGPRYLEAFEGHVDAGRAFVADYRRFLGAHAHGGHADRDLYHARRGDDPSIDYQTFATLLAAERPVAPEDREREVDARRNAVVAMIEAKLRGQRFGVARVRIFRMLFNYVHRFFLYRDNQRHYFDRYTYSMKRGAVEIGRRLHERGVLGEIDDAYFFGRQELWGLLRGEPITAKTKAKLAGRRANFSKQLNHTAQNPKYIRAGLPVNFEQDADGDGLSGVGTSRGQVTGRARVVLQLKDIGQLKDGEILITHSTDPGWTPVFTLLSGIVLETGGMLAHGSLLAREYGFPAVQIEDATRLIPDGAKISLNGDTGTVVIVEEPAST
ncbi:MAG: PEP/pyruvate-binding domain-containing protein [Solirubrobacteraceae bacterium]